MSSSVTVYYQESISVFYLLYSEERILAADVDTVLPRLKILGPVVYLSLLYGLLLSADGQLWLALALRSLGLLWIQSNGYALLSVQMLQNCVDL